MHVRAGELDSGVGTPMVASRLEVCELALSHWHGSSVDREAGMQSSQGTKRLIRCRTMSYRVSVGNDSDRKRRT